MINTCPPTSCALPMLDLLTSNIITPSQLTIKSYIGWIMLAGLLWSL